MTTVDMVWRARAMRLAARYALYTQATPDLVAAVIPTDPRHRQELLAALAEALRVLATQPIHGVTSAEIWELMALRVDVVPVDVRPAVLAVLAATGDVEPTRFAAWAAEAGVDQVAAVHVAAVHVAAMVAGVLGGQLDLPRYWAETAEDLDPWPLRASVRRR